MLIALIQGERGGLMGAKIMENLLTYYLNSSLKDLLLHALKISRAIFCSIE